MKRHIICCLALAGLLAGCSTAQGIGTRTSAPAATQPVASSSTAAHVGDSVSLDGAASGERVTVTLVKVTDNPPPAPGWSADAGKRLYAAQLRITVIGTATYHDEPSFEATVIDSDGQQFNAGFIQSNAGPDFPSTLDITPGSSALGWITFELPSASVVSGLHFEYGTVVKSSVGEWSIP